MGHSSTNPSNPITGNAGTQEKPDEDDIGFRAKLISHMKKRKRKLFFLSLLLLTLLTGYAWGASSIPPIQKPTTVSVQLLNGVQVNSVTVTDWTLNIVQVVLQDSSTVSGNVTVTTNNSGTGSTPYSLTANTPGTFTVTVNAPLLAATLITVKT